MTTPTPGLNRRSVPIARAQLLAWALTVHHRQPDVELPRALVDALPSAAPITDALDGDLSAPPPTGQPGGDLTARIAACLPPLPHVASAVASRPVHHPTEKEQP